MNSRIFGAVALAALTLTACASFDYEKHAIDMQDCLETHAPGVSLGVMGSGMTRAQRMGVDDCMRERGYVR